MRPSIFLGLNLLVLALYAGTALFINTDGTFFGLGPKTSSFATHALMGTGIGLAALSILKWPKQWAVPALCLVVYFAFLL